MGAGNADVGAEAWVADGAGRLSGLAADAGAQPTTAAIKRNKTNGQLVVFDNLLKCHLSMASARTSGLWQPSTAATKYLAGKTFPSSRETQISRNTGYASRDAFRREVQTRGV